MMMTSDYWDKVFMYMLLVAILGFQVVSMMFDVIGD